MESNHQTTSPYSQMPMRTRVKHIHFIGIGGAGMCGIAEVLLNEGYKISGSDLSDSGVTQRLRQLGAIIMAGHSASNIQGADVVVRSTAVKDDNPEVQAAIAARIPVIKRAEMLAELMRFRYGIAIAGTHGKTTTTSLVTSILAEGGLDPTFVIGGKLNSAGTNARLGSSPYFVAEADESDASFLYLKPMISVVTNIDADHMATYNNDFSLLTQTFVKFLHHLPFYGLSVLCIDDPVVKALVPQIARPITTYGFTPDADIYAVDWQQKTMVSHFTVKRRDLPDLEINLSVPGRHNVLNALAAIAIATTLHIEDAAIKRALANFQGIGRRFQSYGDIKCTNGTALLIDDYGHHPSEISSTIAAVRKVFPEKRLVLAFQPHRYTRTQALFKEFVNALSQVDKLFLLEVYSAGEQAIDGVNSKTLCADIEKHGSLKPTYIPSYEDLADCISKEVQAGDVILTQGAGNIGQMAVQLAQQFKVSA